MSKLSNKDFSLRFKRGVLANINIPATKNLALDGEPHWTTDTKQLYMFDGTQNVRVPTADNEGALTLTAGAITTIPLTVKGAVGQTGNLQEWQDSTAAVKASVDKDGDILAGDGTVSAPSLAFASDTDTGFYSMAANYIQATTGGSKSLQITPHSGLVPAGVFAINGTGSRVGGLLYQTPTSTQPSIVADWADGNTGIGRAGADQLSLIAGGVEGAQVTPAGITTPQLNLSTLPPIYANNAAAIAGGLTAGQLYRTGGDPDQLCIVH